MEGEYKRYRKEMEEQSKKWEEERENEERIYKEDKKNAMADFKKKDIGYLIEKLVSTSEARREIAAFYLGELGDNRAVTALIEALKDETYTSVVKNIMEALGKIKDPRVLDYLKKYHMKTDTEEGEAAIRTLNKIKFKRMGKIVSSNIKKMSWQDFEDKIIEALDATPSEKRTSDMGIDGFKTGGIPIQIKQSERIGRNVIDNFETALHRYYPSNKKKKEGIIVAFSFTKGAYTETDRARREDDIDIELVTVDELID